LKVFVGALGVAREGGFVVAGSGHGTEVEVVVAVIWKGIQRVFEGKGELRSRLTREEYSRRAERRTSRRVVFGDVSSRCDLNSSERSGGRMTRLEIKPSNCERRRISLSVGNKTGRRLTSDG